MKIFYILVSFLMLAIMGCNNPNSLEESPITLEPPVLESRNVFYTETNDVTLNWHRSENAELYHVQVSFDSTFSSIKYNFSTDETSVDFTDLKSSTWYYWRVSAERNWSSSSDFSPVGKFYIGPPPPTLISPLDKSTGMPTSLEFSWTDPIAYAYIFQVAGDSLFNDVIYDVNPLYETSKDLYDFTPNKTYFWRVKADNLGGLSEWSKIYSFVTGTCGTVDISSTPSGAAIWVDGSDINAITPAKEFLLSGDHEITLKLAGYKDTTFAMNVIANQQTTKIIVLTHSKQLTFGPVRIYENPSSESGLVLSTGDVISLSSIDKNFIDLYYSSVGSFLRGASPNVNNRNTKFLLGSSTDLNDKIPSPVLSGSWTDDVPVSSTYYFFIHDADNHYSKMIITGRNDIYSKWIEVKWIYNKTPGDVNF